jgi:hypothetical protein
VQHKVGKKVPRIRPIYLIFSLDAESKSQSSGGVEAISDIVDTHMRAMRRAVMERLEKPNTQPKYSSQLESPSSTLTAAIFSAGGMDSAVSVPLGKSWAPSNGKELKPVGGDDGGDTTLSIGTGGKHKRKHDEEQLSPRRLRVRK